MPATVLPSSTTQIPPVNLPLCNGYASSLWKQSPSQPSGNACCQSLFFMSAARTPLFISVLFLSTGLLQHANEAAGCTEMGFAINGTQSYEEADSQEVPCDGTILGGMKPSSILTSLNTVSGLVVVCILPAVGAAIDYSERRREVVVWSFVVFWVANLFQGCECYILEFIFCHRSSCHRHRRPC